MPRALKTRDKVKYGCASLLALCTVVSIAALESAKWRRAGRRAPNPTQAETEKLVNDFGLPPATVAPGPTPSPKPAAPASR